MRLALAIAAALAAAGPGGPARAQALDFPQGADVAAEETEAFGSETLPTGPYSGGSVPTVTVEGAVEKRAWRVGSEGLTTLQIEAPLRDQLAAQGFETVFGCEDRICGGFDFRYALDLLPEPYMHVDIGDFRYLLARKTGPEGPVTVSIVSSRGISGGHAHVTVVRPAPLAPVAVTDEPDPPAGPAVSPTPQDEALPPESTTLPLPGGRFSEDLETRGHVVLEGLTFAVGSSRLSDGEYAGLADLAAYLAANPGAVVVLVGHTDAVGSLDQNVRLSRQRAESVRERLISGFGVRASQMLAEGAGFLAPRASNLTEEGRDTNRRVEVVLLRKE